MIGKAPHLDLPRYGHLFSFFFLLLVIASIAALYPPGENVSRSPTL